MMSPARLRCRKSMRGRARGSRTKREWKGRYGSGSEPEPRAAGTGTETRAKAEEADDGGPLQCMADGREGEVDGDAAGRARPGR
jgi:hypothetical protein